MLKQYLVEIVERASTVEERLGGDFSPTGRNEAVVDERLEAWCQALGKGDWDRLERWLAWDGLDPETVRPALGPVRLRDGAPLPEWSEILAEALQLAPPERREDEAWPAQMGFLDAEDPLPFEEVLAPFVLVARERLAGRTVVSETLLSHDLSCEEQRLAWARTRVRVALTSLAYEASRTPLDLICQLPPPAKPFPYGDVVPSPDTRGELPSSLPLRRPHAIHRGLYPSPLHR